MTGLIHLRVKLDQSEVHNPSLRRYTEAFGVRVVLQPLTLELWTQPQRTFPGTIPGDWEDLGFVQPPTGRATMALSASGETLPLLYQPEADIAYVSLPQYGGRVFRASTITHVQPCPPWPWRILPWRETSSASGLLGQYICLWPLRHDGYWDSFTEPLLVSAVYAASYAQNHGFGVSPAMEGVQHPAPGQWPLRRLSDLAPSLQVHKTRLEDMLRPVLVLWAPTAASVPMLLSREQVQGQDLWRLDEGVNSTYAGFRVVTSDELGSNPDVWADQFSPMSQGWAAIDVNSARIEYQSTWCIYCAKEGRHRVPIVSKSEAACTRHLAMLRRAATGPALPHYVIAGRSLTKSSAKSQIAPALSFSREFVDPDEEQ